MSAAPHATSPDTLPDFTDPAFRRDPYPVYRALRERSPVLQAARGPFRFSVISRHADVTAVLRDPRMSVDRPFQPKPPDPDDGVDPATLHPLARALRALSRVMLFRDPPDHTRLRGLVGRAFTPRRVESLRRRIQVLVDELLAKPLADGGFDLVRDFAEPLPILVIAELLGLPASDRADLKRWSDELAAMLDGSIAMAHLDRAVQSAVAVIDYLRTHLERKRRDPQDDLISAMLSMQERDRLTDDEILGTVLVVMGAGHETTTNLLGNGVLALLRHPDQLALLRANPAYAGSAVEEVLRFDSPVQATSRVPIDDVELFGHRFAKGVEIGLLLGAANRDPEAFDAPDRFDVTRTDNRHLSFGSGIHFCLGAGLARLEGEVGLGSLVARATGLALDAAEDTLAWRPGWLLRGLVSLPVRL